MSVFVINPTNGPVVALVPGNEMARVDSDTYPGETIALRPILRLGEGNLPPDRETSVFAAEVKLYDERTGAEERRALVGPDVNSVFEQLQKLDIADLVSGSMVVSETTIPQLRKRYADRVGQLRAEV